MNNDVTTTKDALRALRKKYRDLGGETIEDRYEKLWEEYEDLREAFNLMCDDRFSKLLKHPDLKRVTTNEKDGGFTFWFK